ncbi:MAG: bifunctional demethylmenaquinone methyltransferase/2-methoxy-6-polyprenyl-1,4-benzoquinol methylase UbiE [Microscillaceae bacterium]|nr:bifunctional demethylmenaquinone methyltransferase/2-methoxy-6-polyprenyl-1,4-benzoquinol methylase UbiE [Microscillaceae bacterium]MDW8461972.1 bifunctional demethylmenaquinone methyltransferase/2-methoxy-6-polyprenyl-1,4-benzoquinol methylase UbiE [Cytophagales bacterium]
MEVVPYKDSTASKKAQVAQMFDNISPKYDFLNHLLSLGIDYYWRWRAIRMLRKHKPKFILDVATGTADFAIEACKLKPQKIIGIDISEGMLNYGRQKINRLKLNHLIELQQADSEKLPFEQNIFDAVIVSFGVRNFENLEQGLANIYRVLKPKGVVLILEFSKPKYFPFKQLYQFYFNRILPFIGKIISKDASAYSYLPESVKVFPDGQDFINILVKTGFKDNQCIPLTFGISSIYKGTKPS